MWKMGKNRKKKSVSKRRMDALKSIRDKGWALLKKFFNILWTILIFPFKVIYLLLRKVWPYLDFKKFEKVKRTQFFLNLAVGVLIVLLLHGLESTQWGEGVLNKTFDLFIRMDANKAVKQDADMGDIFLVDIGHNRKTPKDAEKVNQPINYLSLRDTIANLLKMAFEGDAEIVVLDFFFEEHDCCNPERDEALRRVLSENNTWTKVIFPVNSGQNKTHKPLIFDGEIDNNPNYLRAIPIFYASSSDFIGRYWKAYQEYDNNKILWSIPVLSAALHAGKMKELKEIEQKISGEGHTFGVYTFEMNRDTNRTYLLPVGDNDIYLQRIRYLLIPKDCIMAHREGNIRLPTIDNLMPDRFKNKIVIIGNSDPNVGDSHPTPVGNMPGMFIHGNSLYTLLQGLQPLRAPWWVSILLNIFIIIMAVYLFHYLDSFLADLLGMIAGIVILGFIAYFYFFQNFGIFPNFVFGIAGIGYIETMYSLRELFTGKKSKKEVRKVN
jgi:CHASE2 domain-containing sensor protein